MNNLSKRSTTDLDQLSDYLKQFIVEQDASLYTPIDHASWRFIMKVSRAFLEEKAHPNYLKGLRETGMSMERIPLISEMDEALQKFGWRAVAISGFIPPTAFIEFESMGILPIACDMRKLEHINYTPAPDIVHEAYGHTLFIVDEDYGEFLKRYGETARKAIYSQEDVVVYNAIYNLSIVKEDPDSTPEGIRQAQADLEEAVSNVSWVSEATQLGRLFWWTTEYGLVGSMDDPKIYGAGLISSVSESFDCFGDGVKRLPLDLRCADQDYDITKPQPQLFVTRDFPSLVRVVDDFSKNMAFRRGGAFGLEKALKSKTTTTSQLDSGLQISGTLTRYRTSPEGNPIYLQFTGPVQLACNDHQIEDHGADYHEEGFGSPVGTLKGSGLSPAQLSDADLKKMGMGTGQATRLEFSSGVVVEGQLMKRVTSGSVNLILTFEKCRVTLQGETLFDPAWGVFDMACGTTVGSVYGGAAHRSAYMEVTGGFRFKPDKPKTNFRESNRELNELYQTVRNCREKGWDGVLLEEKLQHVCKSLDKEHPEDWLLRYEVLELLSDRKVLQTTQKKLWKDLEELDRRGMVPENLIQRGLQLLRLSS